MWQLNCNFSWGKQWQNHPCARQSFNHYLQLLIHGRTMQGGMGGAEPTPADIGLERGTHHGANIYAAIVIVVFKCI